jgi:hypothetical protein
VPARARRQRAGAERRGARRGAAVPHHPGRRVARIRQFAASAGCSPKEFKREFTPENVVGVYLPYMVVDANASADVAGFGEVETAPLHPRHRRQQEDLLRRRRLRSSATSTSPPTTSRSRRRRASAATWRVNTNNIINTILPFDTKNAVKWNASYLTGFTSEKRDQDVARTTPRLEDQLLSIARAQVEARGRAATTAACAGSGGPAGARHALGGDVPAGVAVLVPPAGRTAGMLHYIAVNGRTGETMGSVPVQQWKLLLAALTVGTILGALYRHYRNTDKSHAFERETWSTPSR